VWTGEIQRYLGPIVEQTCSCEFNHVRCLAVPFEKALQLPPALRRALAQACREEQPVVSVNQLAQIAGINRRTLWHQWNSVSGISSLRLQDFLHWILLVRAVGRKTPEKTWSDIAEEMGMGVETLARHAKQLTGRTLQQLAAMGSLNLAQSFRRAMYEFLLREGGLAEA
ncbi:MAG: hypothetical protein KY444_05625, partial [Gemmatimonadetes bacterium]|nr:hypothetical protein [Gemmatimonadota bacterium]